ncbi:unnamed protein product [Soboliphyme baturini]|uniref:Uncharacterized protein n=1 Tax=Soboliphyme baturini TaxID=241478 RepID=A0A183J380_9BILA|nr:unnamed protein product [Soboliphyme baturini]
MAISKTTALYVVVGFLSLSTVAFMVAVIVMASTQKASPAPPSPVPKHNVSDQAGWIAAAKNIRLSIDPRVNPCDDFYK